ncbi:MAG: MscL family protein [Tepidisphaeraceae bacterium]|jgi:large conductance mechanosensitive channel
MKSKLWQEFKSFAFKGNMIDLAVAVVIGAAFSGVVNSLVKEIIMPSITYVTMAAQSGAQTAAQVAEKTEAVVGVATQPASTQAASAPPASAPPAEAAANAPAAGNLVNTSWIITRIHFHIRNFLAELLNFLLVSFAVFITIVKLLGSVMKRVGSEPAPSEPTTKECPMCLSLIPIKAKKCAHCTADLP